MGNEVSMESVLLSYVERIERLEEEKKAISTDIREIYKEAEGNKLDSKALATIIKMRRKDPQELEEEEFLVDSYKKMLGM